jgi:hypothetical protein
MLGSPLVGNGGKYDLDSKGVIRDRRHRRLNYRKRLQAQGQNLDLTYG